jgi:hypothetical protein
VKPTREQLLKQLDDLTALAKSKGLLKIDPVTKLPGTFVDKNDEHQPHPGPSVSSHQKIFNAKQQSADEAHLKTPEGNAKRIKGNAARMGKLKKDGSIQAGIAAAGAAGGVPHTTPAGSTLGAVQAMGSAFGKSGNLDKHASRDMANQLRAIYGVSSKDERSIAANNNPEPSIQKKGSSPDQEPGNGQLGMKKSSTQPINEGTSSDMIKSKHIGWGKLHGKLKREGYSDKSADKIAGSIKAKVGKSESGNPDEKSDAKLGESVENLVEQHFKDNSSAESKEGHDLKVDKALAASARGEGTDLNKCDKLKGIIGSLKKGFFLP